MESEISNEIVENSDQLESISSDVKSILQLLTEERELESQDKQVQEKKLLEEEEAQKLLEKEQEEQALLDQQEALEKENIQQEKEQRYFDSVEAQNQKMDTYIEISDGLQKSFDSLNEKTELLIENTTVEDNAEQTNMSYYADLTLVMILWVFLPLYLSYRLIKPFFNIIF